MAGAEIVHMFRHLVETADHLAVNAGCGHADRLTIGFADHSTPGILRVSPIEHSGRFSKVENRAAVKACRVQQKSPKLNFDPPRTRRRSTGHPGRRGFVCRRGAVDCFNPQKGAGRTSASHPNARRQR
ncbi:hypothetical protein [Mesorhizobium sp. LNHC209A00]|uniref:hypothetical protein n=1 Tax=Mesorhizobium sp. LNHC209A00 TaxID=1287226 RepID=UPI0012EB2C64|nr:hypothetical protein [Mesorhizobium sp. LNHC209A00]